MVAVRVPIFLVMTLCFRPMLFFGFSRFSYSVTICHSIYCWNLIISSSCFFHTATGKAPNWNWIYSFQLTNLFQFRARKSTIIYVAVDWHAVIYNKLVDWNCREEQIQFQLGALAVTNNLFHQNQKKELI